MVDVDSEQEINLGGRLAGSVRRAHDSGFRVVYSSPTLGVKRTLKKLLKEGHQGGSVG